ncbi:MAG: hypothetical protein ACPG1A_02590 [Halioglobus sp.]
MGDILEFPTPTVQGMAYLETQLRKMLDAKGADQQLIDFAAEQLTRVYGRVNEAEQYSFSVKLPDGLSEAEKSALKEEINVGLEGIRHGNHALLLQLVAELVLAEVKLFQHQRD